MNLLPMINSIGALSTLVRLNIAGVSASIRWHPRGRLTYQNEGSGDDKLPSTGSRRNHLFVETRWYSMPVPCKRKPLESHTPRNRLKQDSSVSNLPRGMEKCFPALVARVFCGLHEDGVHAWLVRSREQVHASFLGCASSLPTITSKAATNDIFPSGWATM